MDERRVWVRAGCAALLLWLAAAGAALADPPSKAFWPARDTWLNLRLPCAHGVLLGAGASARLAPRAATESHSLHPHDSHASPGALLAPGVILHVF